MKLKYYIPFWSIYLMWVAPYNDGIEVEYFQLNICFHLIVILIIIILIIC